MDSIETVKNDLVLVIKMINEQFCDPINGNDWASKNLEFVMFLMNKIQDNRKFQMDINK